jgi:conserved repeat domain
MRNRLSLRTGDGAGRTDRHHHQHVLGGVVGHRQREQHVDGELDHSGERAGQQHLDLHQRGHRIVRIQVTKTGPPTAFAGTNILYTITVGNAGPSNATAVVLNDPTPPGLTFVSATGACLSFPCTIGAMANGGTALVQATYAISPTASGSITNTATVTSTSTDPTPGNNTASTTMTVTANSDVSITKTLTSTLTAGQNATYNIVVTNNGPSTATGVTVSDPLRLASPSSPTRAAVPPRSPAVWELWHLRHR